MSGAIVLLTDSLGLPRAVPSFVAIGETWPQLLRANFVGRTVHQISLGGATTDDLLAQFSYIEGQSVDAVVVQAGIVDCAPRAFGRRELALLSRFSLGRAVLNLVRGRGTKWLRQARNKTYVSQERYALNVAKICESARGRVVWLQILGSSNYDAIVPGVIRNIESFNKILRHRLGANFVELSSVTDLDLMSDGHHLNVMGHRKTFEAVRRKLEELGFMA